MYKDFKKYWHSLAPRERTLVSVAGVFLVVFLVYSFYIKPFYVDFNRNQTKLYDMRQNYVDIMQQLSIIQSLQSAGRAVEQEKLDIGNALGLLESIAVRHKINGKLNKVQPIGQTKIEVQFKGVDFNSWLRWNNDLALQGVDTDAVNVNSGKNQLVSIRQTLNIE